MNVKQEYVIDGTLKLQCTEIKTCACCDSCECMFCQECIVIGRIRNQICTNSVISSGSRENKGIRWPDLSVHYHLALLSS